MRTKAKWSALSGRCWWCIVRRDFDREWYYPWLMASTRKRAWEEWEKWYGDMATPAFRTHYKAVKVVVEESPDAP